MTAQQEWPTGLMIIQGNRLEDLRSLMPEEWAELFTDNGSLRTLPHRHDGMDAFFAARFIKRQ